MGRSVTGSILIAAAGLDDSNRSDHWIGMIFNENNFHTIIHVEYCGLLRFLEHGLYLVVLIFTVTQLASHPDKYHYDCNSLFHISLSILHKMLYFKGSSGFSVGTSISYKYPPSLDGRGLGRVVDIFLSPLVSPIKA